MRIGTKTRYSVRLLVALGRSGHQPVSLGEISRREDIPRAYLARLALALRNAGILRSTRGARGGYLLAKPIDDISLYDVVMAAEGGISGIPCLTGSDQCRRLNVCAARVLWQGVSEAVEGFLRDTTLADLVGATRGGQSDGGS